jgi:hypothetical protein
LVVAKERVYKKREEGLIERVVVVVFCGLINQAVDWMAGEIPSESATARERKRKKESWMDVDVGSVRVVWMVY